MVTLGFLVSAFYIISIKKTSYLVFGHMGKIYKQFHQTSTTNNNRLKDNLIYENEEILVNEEESFHKNDGENNLEENERRQLDDGFGLN